MSMAINEALKRAKNELIELADAAEKGPLSDEQRSRVDELKAEIEDLNQRNELLADTRSYRGGDEDEAAGDEASGEGADSGEKSRVLRSVAKPTAAPKMEVKSVSPYDAGDKRSSWFKDVATLRDSDASNKEVAEARERLTAHYDSTNEEGSGRQVRALSAGTDAEGGYLVAPAHLQSMFAEYRTAGVAVTNLVSKMPLPAKTDQINLPKQDGATAVAVHTENNAVTETSATFATVQASAVRYAGMQTIPNFLLDRSLPGVDQIILRDLGRQLAVKVNTDIINGTTPEGILNADGIGTATATAGTATFADLWPPLVNAIYDVTGTHYAGRPEAIVMHPRRWAWLLQQLDADSKPLVGAINPFNSPAALANIGQGRTEAASLIAGEVLGIPVYLDANIPTTLGSGTDEDRIIVGVFSEAYLFESAPKFGVSTDNQFGKDQTIARVTQDIAFTAERYPGAFSVISGTALNDAVA